MLLIFDSMLLLYALIYNLAQGYTCIKDPLTNTSPGTGIAGLYAHRYLLPSMNRICCFDSHCSALGVGVPAGHFWVI